jgi:hypothetical protein
VPLIVIERADGFQGLDDSIISEFNFWLDLPQPFVNMHVKQKLKEEKEKMQPKLVTHNLDRNY